MFFRVVACCIGFTATFVLSALGGPFDSYVGKYKGRGVERDSNGSVYYYVQTVKVEGSSQVVTTTLPGVLTMRELVRFRANGTVSGSGSAPGYNYSWTLRGTWKQQGDAIKATIVTYSSEGSMITERRILRFQDGKMVVTASGYSGDGSTMTSAYTGKLQEVVQ